LNHRNFRFELKEYGAALSIHYRDGISRSTNLLWEINGTDGDLHRHQCRASLGSVRAGLSRRDASLPDLR
jgi:hypothetical protein